MFRVYDKRLKPLARDLRQAGNLAEVVLWQSLKGRQLGYTFNRQKPIGKFIPDFVCKDMMLVVEIDGVTHGDRVESDAERQSALESMGYSVLRFTNKDVFMNLEGVITHIRGWIDGDR